MIKYRTATFNDASQIAELHAKSWKENYKGIWSDKYLDGNVVEERIAVWEERLRDYTDKQIVTLAEYNSNICGFSCVYLDHDPYWGSLLDNLHVSLNFKGKGIGTSLLRLAGEDLVSFSDSLKLYLWVLEKNLPAKKFYEKLGAIDSETKMVKSPDGADYLNCRFFWKNINTIKTLN